MHRGGMRYAALAALALLLAGCGFHLRGSLGELAALPPVFVRGDGALARELQRALRDGGTQVVASAATAGLVVILGDVRRERRASAVGSTGRAKEYELHSTVRFRVEDPAGASLSPEQVVSVQRSYSDDGTDVNAKSNEENNLYDDMRYDIVRQIVLRLQAIHPAAPAAAPAAAEPAP